MRTIKWLGGIAGALVVGAVAITAITAGAAPGDATYVKLAPAKTPLAAADKTCFQTEIDAIFPSAGTFVKARCTRRAEGGVDKTRCECSDTRTVTEAQYVIDEAAGLTDGGPTGRAGGNATGPYKGSGVLLTDAQQLSLEACVTTAWGITGATMRILTLSASGSDWDGGLDYHTRASAADYTQDWLDDLVVTRTGTVE